MFGKINDEIINELINIVGGSNVITKKEEMEDYSHDETTMPEIRKYPVVVVKPSKTGEVSAILKLANKKKLPVSARGAGTGLCGGCVPVYDEIVLSLENMNRIIEIDKDNMMATVEAGVSLMEFYKAVEEEGFFFPPHPGEDSAFIGGAAATNAGGSRAVKYGVFRNFIKELEVVLADGSIITVGGKLVKNSTGYSLLNLMIGSEGTLGVITKAVIGLISSQEVTYTLIVPFASLHEAIRVVPEIIRSGIMPMAVEFIEQDVITLSEKYLDKKWPGKNADAYLMLIIDGAADEVDRLSEQIGQICMDHNAVDVLVTENKQKQKEIMDIRSHIYEALKPGLDEVIDICVPRSNIAAFVDKIHEISEKYGMWLPTFGHAADGNIHTHIMKVGVKEDKLDNSQYEGLKEKAAKIKEELYGYSKEAGGVISGEHGIGTVKKAYLNISLDDRQIELMKSIKKVFDPNNILNPGKIFDL